MEYANTKQLEDITVYLGAFNEYNVYRLDEEKEKYSPFIKTFHKLGDFMRWKEEIHSSPLMREKYLAIIEYRATYLQFENLVEVLKSLNNPYIRVVAVVEPRERFINSPQTSFEIIDLAQHHKEDFLRVLHNELPQITKKGEGSLIRKIGYSYSALKLNLPELKEYSVVDPQVVKEVIKETRLAPIEYILFGVINKDNNYIRQHYKLCNKYSPIWVIKTYINILTGVLTLKAELKAGKITYSDIHSKKEHRMYIRLIRDVNTSTIYLMKTFLEKYKNVGFEMFLQTNNNADRLSLLDRGEIDAK